MPLDATVGGTSANSYVTETEADTYYDTRLDNSGWTGAGSRKEPALVTASLMLDARTNWVGSKKSDTQSMQWPRVDENGTDIEAGIIPLAIKQATYELALFILDNGEPSADVTLDSVQVGSIELDFNEQQPDILMPDWIRSIFSDYGQLKAGGSSVKMAAVYR